MTQEAMKLALEALKWSKPHEDAVISHSEAITAIEEALAQPVQEPVAFVKENPCKILPGIKVVNNYKFFDNRGYFVELWNSEIPMRGSYRQLNCAFSTFGVLRGMHYQDQTKFVMPIVGKIFDVVLDPNTGNWFGIELDASKSLLIPPQYAHGYLVLSAEAIVQYVVDAPYDQSKEKLYRWDQYNIEWPTFITPVLSQKDAQV